ncbi:hypothetical protein [Mangrovicoccus algicola]|nr:hypothetical protein [Mangrovicoccus algicola]
MSILGGGILVIVMYDILMSALGTGSSGPLAPRIAAGVFRAIGCLPDRPLIHRACGPLVMASIGACWIALLCLGWTVIFCTGETAIVASSDGQPAGPAGRLSFVGHLFSTLGGGLNEPGHAAWGLVAMLAGLSGMIVLTLSVSFVYSTTQAVAKGRAVLALAEIHGPGTAHFDTILLPQLAGLVAEIKAIPFSLYFSTARAHRRVARALSALYRHPGLGDGERERLRILLRELPGLETVAEDAFGAALEQWARRHSLK